MNAPTIIRHHPIKPPKIDGPRAEIGQRPELTLVRPQDCRVDPAYQRPITGRGRKQIARMIEGWDWEMFDPIKVAEMPSGLWEVIDGQHRVAAALAHGGVDRLPAFVSRAASRGDRARIFVALNETRTAITPAARFKAAVAAGEPWAAAIARVCLEAGVTPMGGTRPGGWRVGDTTAIAALYRLVRSGGQPGLRRALAASVSAGLAPVTSDRLSALAELFSDVTTPTDEALCDTRLAAALGDGWDAVKDAGDLAAMETGQPKARARAVELYRRAT